MANVKGTQEAGGAPVPANPSQTCAAGKADGGKRRSGDSEQPYGPPGMSLGAREVQQHGGKEVLRILRDIAIHPFTVGGARAAHIALLTAFNVLVLETARVVHDHGNCTGLTRFSNTVLALGAFLTVPSILCLMASTLYDSIQVCRSQLQEALGQEEVAQHSTERSQKYKDIVGLFIGMDAIAHILPYLLIIAGILISKDPEYACYRSSDSADNYVTKLVSLYVCSFMTLGLVFMQLVLRHNVDMEAQPERQGLLVEEA